MSAVEHPRLRPRLQHQAERNAAVVRRAQLRRERRAAAARRAGQSGGSARTLCRAHSRAFPACAPAAPAASGAARPHSWSRAAAGAWAHGTRQLSAGLVSAAGRHSEALPGISHGCERRTLRLQAPPARGARASGAPPPPRHTRRRGRHSSRCGATRRRSRGTGARPSRGQSADARGRTTRLRGRSSAPGVQPRQRAGPPQRSDPSDAPGSLNVDMPALADTPLPVKTTRERAARASASAAAVSSAPCSGSAAAAARRAAARRGLDLKPQWRCGKPLVSPATRRAAAAQRIRTREAVQRL